MYDDASMGEKAMDLAREIMGRMMEDIEYISENYEGELYEILGDEGEDEY